MEQIGRILVSIGIVLLLIGGAILLAQKLGFGKLPGDLLIQKGNVTFFFPIVSSIILSILFTLILNLFFRR
ncbi:DUF2905 domain-containing protein [Caldisalinibacter kiritimatiensis]|uniref:DUF2905 domain-containing protein n=1 Tax=Caldisalinibacter kiritimatiensis TaxID=1304284 RepID=R1AU37_9FIRM|nr:DUF2905 domain-containing protein [Caldisalinibacter kiritimatiensis]EOD00673.1 hypothetical protein L21TH_1274 [Caldisalinibacter kiritimatiensis]